jgi:hypothetical protein
VDITVAQWLDAPTAMVIILPDHRGVSLEAALIEIARTDGRRVASLQIFAGHSDRTDR